MGLEIRVINERDVLRDEAIAAVEKALEHLRNPERDPATEVSRLHGIMGLIKLKTQKPR